MTAAQPNIENFTASNSCMARCKVRQSLVYKSSLEKVLGAGEQWRHRIQAGTSGGIFVGGLRTT